MILPPLVFPGLTNETKLVCFCLLEQNTLAYYINWWIRPTKILTQSWEEFNVKKGVKCHSSKMSSGQKSSCHSRPNKWRRERSVCVRARLRVCVRACMCVCVWERESVCVCVCVHPTDIFGLLLMSCLPSFPPIFYFVFCVLCFPRGNISKEPIVNDSLTFSAFCRFFNAAVPSPTSRNHP